MITRILPASDIQPAVEILKSGGLVAFPTDTVYGLGALAFDNLAVQAIYAAKGRQPEKAIPVLIGDLEFLKLVGAGIPPMVLAFASRFWPGPLTCILPKNTAIPPAVSDTPTIAVRIPDHPVARALLLAAGPMAVTSANLSGRSSPSTAKQVHQQLNGRIPLILDGGSTPVGKPSTLVDCTGNEPRILREGPISLEELFQALS